jgi:spore coat protein U-like protein
MARRDKCESGKPSNSAAMKQRMAVLLLLGMLPWACLNAQQSATTTFRVAVKVEESCDISVRNFARLQASTLLRATCTPDATYNVVLARRALSGANTLTGVGAGLAVDHALFGGIPATKAVPAGEFADTVTVHVYY